MVDEVADDRGKNAFWVEKRNVAQHGKNKRQQNKGFLAITVLR
jgi:hypothetical protein